MVGSTVLYQFSWIPAPTPKLDRKGEPKLDDDDNPIMVEHDPIVVTRPAIVVDDHGDGDVALCVFLADALGDRQWRDQCTRRRWPLTPTTVGVPSALQGLVGEPDTWLPWSGVEPPKDAPKE